MQKRLFKKVVIGALSTLALGTMFSAAPVKADSISINDSSKTSSVKPQLIYRLRGLYPRVVQASAIGSNFVYASQLAPSSNDTVIWRTAKPKRGTQVNFSSKQQLRLKGFGHTQTLAYAGSNRYFTGGNPTTGYDYSFDTDIVRVRIPKGKVTYSNLSRLPHLANLKYATDMPQSEYPGIKRAEATVSPNRKYLLIASVDVDNNGHFAIYRLSDVNKALNKVEHKKNQAVSLRTIHQVAAFHINHFFGNGKNKINSLQGYAIDDDNNIYISSELSPQTTSSSMPREIVKIKWGDTNPKDWEHFNVNDSSWNSVATELEGLEIPNGNLNLTVAYHAKNSKHTTLENRIYRIPASVTDSNN